MPFADIFTTFLYQPFLNILVGIYWLLDLLPTYSADMGVAVIIFTIVVRVLMLPITFAGERSEGDRREIEKKLKELQTQYATNPIMLQQETKRLMHRNSRVVISEIITLAIQVIIALMLWRIFATGLTGEDLHLIYPWMPAVQQPFNLTFLGRFDLTHPNLLLNLIQALLIAAFEMLHIISSPHPVSKNEVVRLQLTLPIVSFVLFAFLPAGKKIFIITSLIFSIIYRLIRVIQRFIQKLLPKPFGDSTDAEALEQLKNNNIEPGKTA